MSPPTAESELASACRQLIDTAVRFGVEHSGSTKIPAQASESTWMEPNEAGAQTYVEETSETVSFHGYWVEGFHTLRDTDAWKNARDAIEAYENTYGHSSDMQWQGHDAYCQQLINEYFRLAGRFETINVCVKKATLALAEFCKSPTNRAKSIVALEDFSAPDSFSIGLDAVIRPITQAELIEYGSLNFPLGSPIPRILPFSQPIPRRDWWICELVAEGQSGTPDPHNKASSAAKTFADIMPVIQEGRLTIIPSKTSKESLSQKWCRG